METPLFYYDASVTPAALAQLPELYQRLISFNLSQPKIP
jgi:hypothetical protein